MSSIITTLTYEQSKIIVPKFNLFKNKYYHHKKTQICGLTVPIADVHELVRNDKVSVVRGSRRRHRQAVHVKDARRNGEQSNGLADKNSMHSSSTKTGPIFVHSRSTQWRPAWRCAARRSTCCSPAAACGTTAPPPIASTWSAARPSSSMTYIRADSSQSSVGSGFQGEHTYIPCEYMDAVDLCVLVGVLRP